MSANRKYRRALERKLIKDKDPMAAIKEQSQRVYEELHRDMMNRPVDSDTHDLVSAMYYLFGLALKREYGFGPQRVLRAYRFIDNELAKWQSGQMKGTDFRKMTMEEVGIDLQIQ